MRPASILYFERLVYLGLALIAAKIWLASGPVEVTAELAGSDNGSLVLELLITIAVNLLLVWLIAYRASKIARWFFILLCVLDLLSLLFILFAQSTDLRASGDVVLGIELAIQLLQAIEIWLLFRRDARDWFAGRAPIDPEIFH
jgi:hypothetical protein